MRGWLFALVFAACAFVGDHASYAQQSPAQPAQTRYALLIGNATYTPGVGPLTNPPNDVRIMATVLRQLGFEVITHTNMSSGDMRVAIAQHADRLANAGEGAIGFFFYAGHGLANEDGVAHLIPIDAQNIRDRGTWAVALQVEQDVVGTLARARHARQIVVIDACRNEIALPQEGRGQPANRGFPVMISHPQMVIAFSSRDGQVASDGVGSPSSPYTAALSSALEQPGATLRDIFTSLVQPVRRATEGQSPDFRWSLEEDIVLRPNHYSPEVRGVIETAEAGAPLIWALQGGACRSDAPSAACWPWNAALRIRAGDSVRYHCAGAAISPRHVLTSAACIQRLRSGETWIDTASAQANDNTVSAHLEAVIGVADLARTQASNVFRVGRVTVHPSFQGLNQGVDLAVLELDRPWDGEALALNTAEQLPTGTRLAFAGFGAPASNGVQVSGEDGAAGRAPIAALTGDIEVVEHDAACSAELAPLSGASPFTAATQFCVRPLPERGSCDGDGGGVMIGLDANMRPVGVGVASFGKGDGCGDPRNPTYLTRLSALHAWIQNAAPGAAFAPVAIANASAARRTSRAQPQER